MESADPPKEHQALRGDAEHMREMAKRHRSIASYLGTKIVQRQHVRDHCKDLGTSFENAAEQYDAPARAHEEAAGS